MANRTSKGNVTQEAREKYGDKNDAYPIFDKQSARAALRLRGHADTPAERRSIINRAAKYDPNAAAKAREADKKAGKI